MKKKKKKRIAFLTSKSRKSDGGTPLFMWINDLQSEKVTMLISNKLSDNMF